MAEYCKPQTCLKFKFKTFFFCFVFPPRPTGCFLRIFPSAPRTAFSSYLLVLLRLLPAPPPLQGFPFHPFIHQGIKGFAKHEISIVETPHTCTERGGGRKKQQRISESWHFPIFFCYLMAELLQPATKPREVVNWETRAEKCEVSRAKPRKKFNSPQPPVQSLPFPPAASFYAAKSSSCCLQLLGMSQMKQNICS